MKRTSLKLLTLSAMSIAIVGLAQPPPQIEPWYQQLDPQMKVVIDELISLKHKPLQTLSAVEARKQPTPTTAVMQVLAEKHESTLPQPVGSTKDSTVPGDGYQIPVRFYYPKGAGPFPVVVYYHGGGFVIATIATYDASPRAIADGANAIVIAVEYRKAPEHKYPAARDDAYAAYVWAVKNAKTFNGDPDRVAVAGESAGGNLATVVSMMARDRGFKLPVHQVLVYPVVNDDLNTPSYNEYATAVPLNKPMMGWFFKNYVPQMGGPVDPYLTPYKGSVKGLEPATIIGAQIDPLQSEGKMYADKLLAAGIAVDYQLYPGTTHEFFGMGKLVDKAKQAEDEVNRQLKIAFGGK